MTPFQVGDRVRVAADALDRRIYQSDGEVVGLTPGNVLVYVRKAGDMTSRWNPKKPGNGVVPFAEWMLARLVFTSQRSLKLVNQQEKASG
jgi:hypothetical protein